MWRRSRTASCAERASAAGPISLLRSMAGFLPRCLAHVGRSAERARELRPGAREERVGRSDGAPPGSRRADGGRRHRGRWVVRVGGSSLHWVGMSSEGLIPSQVGCDPRALQDDSVPCRANDTMRWEPRGGAGPALSPPQPYTRLAQCLGCVITGTVRRRRTPMCVRDRG